MKRYKITLPTPQRCTELGIKFEGLETRTRLWLVGFANGVAAVSQIPFRLMLPKNGFIIETNSEPIVNSVTQWVTEYGHTVTPVAPPIPNCPSCNGERELSGTGEGIYKCCFCGLVTT